jgi:hypothetical protein
MIFSASNCMGRNDQPVSRVARTVADDVSIKERIQLERVMIRRYSVIG